jgi:hypothetical protein
MRNQWSGIRQTVRETKDWWSQSAQQIDNPEKLRTGIKIARGVEIGGYALMASGVALVVSLDMVDFQPAEDSRLNEVTIEVLERSVNAIPGIFMGISGLSAVIVGSSGRREQSDNLRRITTQLDTDEDY